MSPEPLRKRHTPDVPTPGRDVPRGMREVRHIGPRDARSCDVAAAELAGRQRALVATWQLAELGLDKDDIRRRVNSGRLHPYHRGVYSLVPKQALPSLAAEQAALLACGPGSVLGYRTALAIYRLAQRDPTTVDVIVPKQRRNRAGIRVHRAADLQPQHVRTRERLPVTSPYRSILDLAPQLSERELDYAVSEGLTQRLITDAQAKTLVDDPKVTRSEAEWLLLRLITRAGLPTPRTNAKVAGYEVDFFWPGANVVVEFNGFQYHGHRRAFERDHRKQLALAAAGYNVVRISWRQLVQEPELVVASLARLL